jgi:hypothetical protein
MSDGREPSADGRQLILAGAYKTGLLTRKSVQGLAAIPDSSEKISRGLGSPPTHDRVFLVSIMPDDSGSIFNPSRNNSQWVARGHNDIIDELRQLSHDKDAHDVLLHTRYLNGKVLNPYTALETARVMDSTSYQDEGGTPLYAQTVILLGTVMAKTVQLAGIGARARTFTLLISDGADRHSENATAETVASLVGDMLVTGNHIVAAMGVNDGKTDYQAVFQRMGIKPGWIFSVDGSRDKIREAFQGITNELRQIASGSDTAFTRLALGPGPVS